MEQSYLKLYDWLVNYNILPKSSYDVKLNVSVNEFYVVLDISIENSNSYYPEGRAIWLLYSEPFKVTLINSVLLEMTMFPLIGISKEVLNVTVMFSVSGRIVFYLLN